MSTVPWVSISKTLKQVSSMISIPRWLLRHHFLAIYHCSQFLYLIFVCNHLPMCPRWKEENKSSKTIPLETPHGARGRYVTTFQTGLCLWCHDPSTSVLGSGRTSFGMETWWVTWRWWCLFFLCVWCVFFGRKVATWYQIQTGLSHKIIPGNTMYNKNDIINRCHFWNRITPCISIIIGVSSSMFISTNLFPSQGVSVEHHGLRFGLGFIGCSCLPTRSCEGRPSGILSFARL